MEVKTQERHYPLQEIYPQTSNTVMKAELKVEMLCIIMVSPPVRTMTLGQTRWVTCPLWVHDVLWRRQGLGPQECNDTELACVWCRTENIVLLLLTFWLINKFYVNMWCGSVLFLQLHHSKILSCNRDID